jgi:hypothetical protein
MYGELIDVRRTDTLFDVQAVFQHCQRRESDHELAVNRQYMRRRCLLTVKLP